MASASICVHPRLIFLAVLDATGGESVSRGQCSDAANARRLHPGREQDGSLEEGCPCCRDGGHRQGSCHRDAQHRGFLTRGAQPFYGLAKVRPDAFCVGLLMAESGNG
jgi:hypothetical protein